MDTAGEGGHGANRESSTNIYTLVCVNSWLVGSCCRSQEVSSVLCNELGAGGGVGGREA